jgi:hypothetical protein
MRSCFLRNTHPVRVHLLSFSLAIAPMGLQGAAMDPVLSQAIKPLFQSFMAFSKGTVRMQMEHHGFPGLRTLAPLIDVLYSRMAICTRKKVDLARSQQGIHVPTPTL